MKLTRSALAILLTIWVASAQVRTLTGPAWRRPPSQRADPFPSGTYTTCAQGLHNPEGNIFLNTAGWQPGAVLTLSPNDGGLKATYVDQGGLSQVLNFTTVTATSAVLRQPAQVNAGLSGVCVTRPRSSAPYPASMSVTAGALTYNAGTVFITLTGGLVAEAGACGRLSQPDASYWLMCKERVGGSVNADGTAAPQASQLSFGEYSCRSQVESFAQFNGVKNSAGGGATGALTLTRDVMMVSASYAGDSYFAGTLRFNLTTSTTAGAEAGQIMRTPCTIPMGTGIPSPTPRPLAVAAGSLTLVGSKLFVSFAGRMDSSCADAQVVGALICSKVP